jgi:hypothetical protein
MPLQSGDKLGLYEILAAIGAGGMATFSCSNECGKGKRAIAVRLSSTRHPARMAGPEGFAQQAL